MILKIVRFTFTKNLFFFFFLKRKGKVIFYKKYIKYDIFHSAGEDDFTFLPKKIQQKKKKKKKIEKNFFCIVNSANII